MPKYERCFCDCDEFRIFKVAHRWCIKCVRCKCERVIKTPGVSVTEYEISVPFFNDHPDQPEEVSNLVSKPKCNV